MNIRKIDSTQVRNNQNKAINNKQYNPFYFNNAQDTVSFTGNKKSFKNHLAARIATIALALSSVISPLSGCVTQNTKQNETSVATSSSSEASETEKEIEALMESVEAPSYFVDINLLTPSEFDYTNVLENDIKLIDHIAFDDETTSIFELNEQSSLKRYNDDNIGSATVLTSTNRKNKTTEIENSKVIIPDDIEEYTVFDLIQDSYENLSANETNTAAWAILDNNEEILKETNITYLTVQMAEQYKEDLGLEENIPNYALEAIKDIARNNFSYDNEAYAFLNVDESAIENLSPSQLKEIKEAKVELEKLNSQRDSFKTIDESTKAETIPSEIIFMTDISSIENKEVVTPTIYTLTNVGKYGTKYIQDVGFPARWYDLELKGDEDLTLDEAKIEIQNTIGQQYSGEDGKQLPQDKDGNYILSSYAGQNILKTILLDEKNNELFDGEIINNVNTVIDVLAEKMINGEDVTLSTPDTTLSFIYKNQLNDPVSYAVANRKVEFSYLHVDKTAVALSELQELALEDGRQEAVALDLLNYVEYNGVSLKEAIEKSKDTSSYEEMITLGASAITQLAETNPKIFNNILADSRFTPEQLLNVKIAAPYVNGEAVEDYTIQLENIVYMNEVAAAKPQKTPSSSTTITVKDPEPSDTPTIIPTPDPDPTTPKPTTPRPTNPPRDHDDPDPDPTPTNPTPTNPAPTDPTPTDPTPTDPTPTDPTPTNPTPTDPTPTDPTPTNPTPTDPTPTCPTGPDVPIEPENPPISEDIPNNNTPDSGADFEDEPSDDGNDITQGGDTEESGKTDGGDSGADFEDEPSDDGDNSNNDDSSNQPDSGNDSENEGDDSGADFDDETPDDTPDEETPDDNNDDSSNTPDSGNDDGTDADDGCADLEDFDKNDDDIDDYINNNYEIDV